MRENASRRALSLPRRFLLSHLGAVAASSSSPTPPLPFRSPTLTASLFSSASPRSAGAAGLIFLPGHCSHRHIAREGEEDEPRRLLHRALLSLFRI
ncbi:hypothetical protein ACQJBY_023836 [Aegilops geniculata]